MAWEFHPNLRSLLDIFVKTFVVALGAVDVYLFQTFIEDLTKNIAHVRKAQ